MLKLGEPVPSNPCITIGNFDGLHRAHQLVVAELKNAAQRLGRTSGLVTFEPSPQLLIHQEFPFILTPFPEKQERLARLGLDFTYVIPFDERLRQLAAVTFLKEVILEPLRPRVIVIGLDHRFGSDRKGDAALMAEFQAAYHFELRVLPEFQQEGTAVKSTRIRERLVLGAVRDAAELLGYRYTIRGRVVRGRNVGAKLGFPTVNVEPESPEKLIPASGVYAVLVTIQPPTPDPRSPTPNSLFGAMNIGFRPTFEGGAQTLEVHILDFSGQLYDRTLTIEFVERLRPERKFALVEDLKNQIAADVTLARIVLAEAGSGIR